MTAFRTLALALSIDVLWFVRRRHKQAVENISLSIYNRNFQTLFINIFFSDYIEIISWNYKFDLLMMILPQCKTCSNTIFLLGRVTYYSGNAKASINRSRDSLLNDLWLVVFLEWYTACHSITEYKCKKNLPVFVRPIWLYQSTKTAKIFRNSGNCQLLADRTG